MRAVLICACLLLGGCLSEPPGSTIITVKVDDPEVERQGRERLHLVEEAVQKAALAYGMESVTIEVVVRDLGGLGQTAPDVGPLLRVHAATIEISTTLFVDPEPDLEDVLAGLMAHEMAHALHYAHMSDRDIAVLGERYVEFSERGTAASRDWVESYERLTDMTAIAFGFAQPLIAQKIASQDNITHHHPKNVWTFYLTPDEIRLLDDNREALRSRMDHATARLGLASLTRLVESFDAGGG